jgi:hypothetical protein
MTGPRALQQQLGSLYVVRIGWKRGEKRVSAGTERGQTEEGGAPGGRRGGRPLLPGWTQTTRRRGPLSLQQQHSMITSYCLNVRGRRGVAICTIRRVGGDKRCEGANTKSGWPKRVDQRAGCRSTDRRGDNPGHRIGSNGYHVPPLLIVHDSQSVTYKYDGGGGEMCYEKRVRHFRGLGSRSLFRQIWHRVAWLTFNRLVRYYYNCSRCTVSGSPSELLVFFLLSINERIER